MADRAIPQNWVADMLADYPSLTIGAAHANEMFNRWCSGMGVAEDDLMRAGFITGFLVGRLQDADPETLMLLGLANADECESGRDRT